MEKRNTTQHIFHVPMYFRLTLLLVLSALVWTPSSAQALKDYNRFSAEISGGLHIPLSPTDDIKTGDYIGFQQFHVGVRYMLSPKFGLKVFFATNKFDGGERGEAVMGGGAVETIDYHNTFTRVGVEGVANLGDLLNLNPRFLDKNGILIHAGAGLTFSSPASRPGRVDRMGIIVAGITPQRKLSERFTVFADLTYVANLKQHYSYRGLKINEDLTAVVGGFASVSFGLTYYLGGNKEHADWYWGN